MNLQPYQAERRHYPRTYLGLPVRVHFVGKPGSVTLELTDISVGGAGFRAPDSLPEVGEWIAFGFVLEDRRVCAAKGRVVRLEPEGFALSLESTNSAFRSFVDDISGPFLWAA
jgi:hypothetical protein